MTQTKVKNRLKYWRHILQIDTQTEFAELLEVTPQQLNNWENHKSQPSVDTYIGIWLKLRMRIPGLNLQDLIEYTDPE